MAERSPEDVLAGVLRITVGGMVKTVPTLKIAQIAEWANLLDTITNVSPTLTDWTDRGVSAVASISNDAYLSLVVAYDRTGALGGREWLEEHADPQELSDALGQMANNAFPLGGGGAAQASGAMAKMLLRTLATLVPPSSTNGASGNGTSRQKPSARHSTRSR